MNSQTAITAIIAALCASIAFAEDFKTSGGKEYKDAIITHVEADGIVVKSKAGISKIYFAELPPGIQQRFHYDPQTAAAAQASEMAAIQQANQQTSEANQQKALESQLAQLRQEEENLRVEIGEARNAPRLKQPSQPSLAAQAREESLTARGKERQLKRREREYEGAKQAAARNGLNASIVPPPRYGDAAKYHPFNQGGGAAQNVEQGSVTRSDLPALESQLKGVHEQEEQVQRELARKAQAPK